jgi:hypothetical protein
VGRVRPVGTTAGAGRRVTMTKLDADRWWDRGLCREKGLATTLFFPDSGPEAVRDYPRCRIICAACTVRLECLDDALRFDSRSTDPYGFAGGMTPDERKVEARRRRGNA